MIHTLKKRVPELGPSLMRLKGSQQRVNFKDKLSIGFPCDSSVLIQNAKTCIAILDIDRVSSRKRRPMSTLILFQEMVVHLNSFDKAEGTRVSDDYILTKNVILYTANLVRRAVVYSERGLGYGDFQKKGTIISFEKRLSTAFGKCRCQHVNLVSKSEKEMSYLFPIPFFGGTILGTHHPDRRKNGTYRAHSLYPSSSSFGTHAREQAENQKGRCQQHDDANARLKQTQKISFHNSLFFFASDRNMKERLISFSAPMVCAILVLVWVQPVCLGA